MDDYFFWIAQSFHRLLHSNGDQALENPTAGLLCAMRDLCAHHFDGQYSPLARAMNRNKSVVGTWLSRGAAPSWDAVCELSYLFQVPFEELFGGQQRTVQLSKLQALPRLAAPRSIRRRTDAEAHDSISRLLLEVGDGLHPDLMSVDAIAEAVSVHRRTVFKHARMAGINLGQELEARRSTLRRSAELQRKKDLQRLSDIIGREFAHLPGLVCRRTTVRCFKSMGMALRWSEYAEAQDLVNESAIRHRLVSPQTKD